MSNSRQRMKGRRVAAVVSAAVLALGLFAYSQWKARQQTVSEPPVESSSQAARNSQPAIQALGRLAVQASASSAGYTRDQFGSGWGSEGGCDTRNRILQRDLEGEVLDPADNCTVESGVLNNDPYTGLTIQFQRGKATSSAVQIDHIVALSNAWQTGAQLLTPAQRKALANDPLNLLAADGPANMQKSDSDASEWLPQASFRCRYVARQIAVKLKYMLWVTPAEHSAMEQVLGTCPTQVLPVEGAP